MSLRIKFVIAKRGGKSYGVRTWEADVTDIGLGRELDYIEDQGRLERDLRKAFHLPSGTSVRVLGVSVVEEEE